MKMRTSRRRSLVVDVAPLIDVVFMLLIFFMVTTTFDKSSVIKIALPEASKAPAEKKDEPIELAIDSQGRYYVNSQQLVSNQVDALKTALQNAKGNRKDAPLIISADAQTTHQSVVTAMDAARQVGLVRLSIATVDHK